MSTAWVLLTAMPPTKGHIDLVNFACQIGHRVDVVICTQPEEPFVYERVDALRNSFDGNVQVYVNHYNQTVDQDPKTPGFQEMWNNILIRYGACPGDYVVASEPYGIWLAEGIGGTFIPYDPDRSIKAIKAERVREDPIKFFDHIALEFQHHLRTDVVFFGAESTGKTFLSRLLAHSSLSPNGHWFFEWARPYLETVGDEITIESMTDILIGQRALQRHARNNFHDKPCHYFDTDLFSTVGYWELPHWTPTLGPCPQDLIDDAQDLKADLYIICPSNIPFEEDPLRYGGDQRESSDQYWIDLAEKYELPYVVLEHYRPGARHLEAHNHITSVVSNKMSKLTYDRGGF